jgi:hypothetical protein
VIVDMSLLEMLVIRIRVRFVAVRDARMIVLVPMTGQLMLPVLAMPEIVRHMEVLVVMHGGLVSMLLHRGCLLVSGDSTAVLGCLVVRR